MLCCAYLLSCPILWDPSGLNLPGFSIHGDSPGENTGEGCHALLQGICLTQGLNLHLLHLLNWQVGSLTRDTWEVQEMLAQLHSCHINIHSPLYLQKTAVFQWNIHVHLIENLILNYNHGWNFKHNSKQKSNFPEHIQYEIMYVIKKF